MLTVLLVTAAGPAVAPIEGATRELPLLLLLAPACVEAAPSWGVGMGGGRCMGTPSTNSAGEEEVGRAVTGPLPPICRAATTPCPPAGTALAGAGEGAATGAAVAVLEAGAPLVTGADVADAVV